MESTAELPVREHRNTGGTGPHHDRSFLSRHNQCAHEEGGDHLRSHFHVRLFRHVRVFRTLPSEEDRAPWSGAGKIPRRGNRGVGCGFRECSPGQRHCRRAKSKQPGSFDEDAGEDRHAQNRYCGFVGAAESGGLGRIRPGAEPDFRRQRNQAVQQGGYFGREGGKTGEAAGCHGNRSQRRRDADRRTAAIVADCGWPLGDPEP